MTLFTKLVFVADKVNSLNEKYNNEVNQIKSIIFTDLDEAVIQTFNLVIKNLLEQNKLIYSQLVNSRNKMLLSLKQGNKL